MITLDATFKSLQVVLAGAITTNQLDWYTDHTVLEGIVLVDYLSTTGLTNSGTAVEMVPAPTGTQRKLIKSVSVVNTDTAVATITVQVDVDGTAVVLFKAAAVPVGGCIHYRNGEWTTNDADGSALGGGGGGVTDHGALTGLSDDDHSIYTLADGTRAFTGDIDLGGNAVTNVGNVDGVDVSAHAARHANGGGDAVDHDTLTNFVANEHIDWTSAAAGTIHTDNYIEGGAGTDTTAIHDNTASEISAITAKATPVAGDFFVIEDSAAANVKKSATFSAIEGALDHDALTNFVADEHVAHSGVTVTAGTGLTGGGTIDSTITLNVIGGNGITANANDVAVTPGDLITGGSAEIDGDQLDVDFTPSNYTPSTAPAEASNVDHLTAHLSGIDTAIGAAGGGDPDSLFWTAESFYGPASNPAQLNTTGISRGASFDDTTSETTYVTGVVPAAGFDATWTIRVWWHSFATSGTTQFDISFMRFISGTTDVGAATSFDTAKTLAGGAITVNGTANTEVEDEVTFTSAEADDLAAGERFVIQLVRNIADTSVGDSVITAVQMTGA